MVSDGTRIQFATASDGVRIAYAEMGDGPPLICMPGWVSHVELELEGAQGEFNRRLARAFRFIRYDGRGTGVSDRNVEDFSVEARLRDLEAVVAHQQLDQFTLFAWSQASPVALLYAARNPERVRQLVLFASFCQGGQRDEREKTLARALLDLMRAEWGVGIRTTMGFTHPDADREEIDQGLAYLRASSTGEVAARILEEGMFRTAVCDELPDITAPTLVVHRRDDKAVPLESGRRVASLIANARFVVLDGDHHMPFSGDADPVMRAVEEFLGIEPPLIAQAQTAPSWPPLPQQALVTILFTDMEGSTSLTEHLGDASAQELVRAHNGVVREALAAHGATEVKHTGDGIMASFGAASSALESAIAIQRALARHNEAHDGAAIRVRIGLNAGEPVREQDDLFGTAVQLARRICDQAEPGRILVSNVVRELVAGKGFLFAERGETALRGFEDAVRLYELRWQE